MRSFLHHLNRLLGLLLAALQWLALPLVVLLFLQWPLRDLLHAGSTLANDMAQLAFALYVAAGVSAATRSGVHLAADTLARHWSAAARARLRKLGVLFGALPWSAFVLLAGWKSGWTALLQQETFPDTGNPGYFVLRLALLLLAGLMLLQALLDLALPAAHEETH